MSRTPEDRHATRARWPRIALGWVLAALFVGLAFRRVSLDAVLDVLRSARPAPLGIALIVLAGGFAVRVVRWWRMMRVLEPGLPLRACARPFLVSIAVNNTLPLRAGDVVRAVGFRSTLRSPPMAVVGTLLVERLLDVLVLLALLFAGLLVLGRDAIPRPFFVAATLGGLVAGAAMLTLVVAPSLLRRVTMRVIARIPSLRWRHGAGRLADPFFASLAIVRPPSRAIGLLGLSVLAWALEGSAYACVAWSIGSDGAPLAPWFALATGTLATMIPSSPGYVGTFDYFAVLGLMAFGTTRIVALAVALLVHLLLWLPVTIVGAVYLVVPGGRRVVSEESQPVSATSEAA